MPEYSFQDEQYFLIVILATIILTGLFVGLVRFCVAFTRELRYVNNEIKRTRGAERKYWLQQRRRLWLSLIPFVKY
jgi:hypothetical protein